jgi:hypothetical protein
MIKTICGKIIIFFERIFFLKFLDWAGPSLTILVWVGVVWPSEQLTLHYSPIHMLREQFTLHCSCRTVEDEAGEEENEEEEKRICGCSRCY